MKKLLLTIIISCLAFTALPQKKYTVIMRNGVLMAITDTTYIYQMLDLKLNKANFQDSLLNYDLLYGSDSTNFRTFSDLKYVDYPNLIDSLNQIRGAIALIEAGGFDTTFVYQAITLKLNSADTTNFRTFSNLKYATASHTHIDFFDTLSYSINIPDTVIAGDNAMWKIPNNITITEIASFTNTGTVTFNIEERAETTPNTAGTDVIGSDLVADTNQEETSTFSNASIDRDDWLALVVASITGDPTLFGVTIKYIKAN